VRPKVYIETSVISYLAARPSRDLIVAANQQITNEWWLTKKINYDIFISQLTVQEAAKGDPNASKKRLELIQGIPLLSLSAEIREFSKKLITNGSLPTEAAEDAIHIAIAAINGMDYLLTWNFKHIANATIRYKVEKICRMNGFEPPIICTPQELMEE
jgi:hypothetical protein